MPAPLVQLQRPLGTARISAAAKIFFMRKTPEAPDQFSSRASMLVRRLHFGSLFNGVSTKTKARRLLGSHRSVEPTFTAFPAIFENSGLMDWYGRPRAQDHTFVPVFSAARRVRLKRS